MWSEVVFPILIILVLLGSYNFEKASKLDWLVNTEYVGKLSSNDFNDLSMFFSLCDFCEKC